MAKEYKVIQVAVPVGYARYPRPAVVVCVVSETRKVVAVSTKLPLFRPGEHFIIRSDHPDFPKTGLTETSYAHQRIGRIERRSGNGICKMDRL